MKRRKRLAGVIVAALIACASSFPVFADVPYDTYTYSYTGKAQFSSHLYVPEREISLFGELGSLKSPSDIITDPNGNLVVADRENNRVVVLTPDLTPLTSISSFQTPEGDTDGFAGPRGVFAANGLLYVADTDNGRIVVLDGDYRLSRILPAPSADVLPENFIYRPKAVAVDGNGRLYVVSMNTNMGVIALDRDGGFEGFIGAQRVEVSAIQLFWRMFMTEEQIERSVSFVPMEFSNLTIDAKGFVYVTSSSIDRYSLFSAVQSRSMSSTYAPIRKLSMSGTDVLRRNGFFPPVGDINFDAYGSAGGKTVNPSSIIEVCLLDNDTYLLVDEQLNKLFLYDSYGNLLGAFGGSGTATGLFTSLTSVTGLGQKLYALDAVKGSITVFSQTAYGALIEQAVAYQEQREFDKMNAAWEEVAAKNGNFDIAFLGMGKTLLEQGDYQSAMEYFQMTGNKDYYSRAFSQYRLQFLRRYGLIIFVAALLLLFLIVRFFHWAKKKNERSRGPGEKESLGGELLFLCRVMFHPFKGFWELKQEKRGSTRAAMVLLGILVAAYAYNSLAPGYLFSNPDATGNLATAAVGVLIPFFLWCVSSWCLTSLMDGKGTMKDILVYTSYAVAPLAMFLIPATLLSNFLILDEASILSMAIGLGTAWSGLLLFFGTLTVHDYSLGKGIVVCLLTIVGIAFILFLLMIFFNLTGNMVSFAGSVIHELQFRV